MESIFIPLSIAITALILPAHATSEQVMWSDKWTTSTQTNSLTCSAYLAQQGYTTLGQYPKWPDVGGMGDGSSTADCGSCYQISSVLETSHFLVVDKDPELSLGAYATITTDLVTELFNDIPPAFGPIKLNVVKVDASFCA